MNHVFWYVLSHGEFRVLYVAEFEFVCSSEVEIWEMMMESVEGFLSMGKTIFSGRLTSLVFCGLLGWKGIGEHSQGLISCGIIFGNLTYFNLSCGS